MEIKKRNRRQPDALAESEAGEFYVDFYDMIDGWGGFGFFTERLFDDLEEAIKLCNKLNSELSKSNRMCGEHFGIIDRDTKREVYCGMDKDYKLKLSEMINDMMKSGTGIKRQSVNKIEISDDDWIILEKYWKSQYEEDYLKEK